MLIDTPCIGICSSVYGDPICRGCKRTAIEVIEWNRYTLEEKDRIYQRLHTQISVVLFKYIDIVDESLLQQKVKQLKIRLHARAGCVEQAYHVLRLGAGKIKDLTRYGLRAKLQFAHLSLRTLFDQIDEEIYASAPYPAAGAG